MRKKWSWKLSFLSLNTPSFIFSPSVCGNIFFPPPLHSLALDFSEHPPFPHPSSMEVLDSIPLSYSTSLIMTASKCQSKEWPGVWLPSPLSSWTLQWGASHNTPHWQPVAATADIFRNKNCIYPEQVLTERTTKEHTSRKLNPEGRTHV